MAVPLRWGNCMTPDEPVTKRKRCGLACICAGSNLPDAIEIIASLSRITWAQRLNDLKTD